MRPTVTAKILRGKTIADALQIDAVRGEIVHYCDLGEQVIDQTRRRVIDGEQVPNKEKMFSIFETHTDLSKRGKVRKPLEFGHKVFLAGSAIGLITQYEVLKGNPADEIHVVPSRKEPPSYVQSCAETLCGRSWLRQRAKCKGVQARRR
jgi:transposase, IS5 family